MSLKVPDSLTLMMRYVHWVSHSLTPTQKIGRSTLASALLRRLGSVQHQGWELIATPGELHFYILTGHEQVWLCPEEQPPQRPRYTIQVPQVMLMIAGDPVGFHLIERLPTSKIFNTENHSDTIFTVLLLVPPQVHGRKLVIHQ
jgi:hypothetical protein